MLAGEPIPIQTQTPRVSGSAVTKANPCESDRAPASTSGGRSAPGRSPQAKRFTNASAVSATSRQPLSIVNECPRFGILTISVTAAFRFCRL